MQRVQEYERQQMLNKIEYDSERVATMKEQKAQLMEQRLQLRADADMQRRNIMEQFERMKKKSNPKDLDPITGLPKAFASLLSPGAGSSKPSRAGSATIAPLNRENATKKVDKPPFSEKEKRRRKRSEEKKRQKSEEEKESNDDYEDDEDYESEDGKGDTKTQKEAKDDKQKDMKARTLPPARVRNDPPRKIKELKVTRRAPEKRAVRPQTEEQLFQRRNSPSKLRALARQSEVDDASPYKNKFNFSLLGPSKSARHLPTQGKAGLGTSRSLGNFQKRSAKTSEGQRMHVIHDKLRPGQQVTRAEAERQVEELAADQNGYLLMLLEKERSNEEERERIYHAVKDPAERKRLDRIFSIERSNASDIINAITNEHETVLSIKMDEMGLRGH
jgi:hypothetical protein